MQKKKKRKYETALNRGPRGLKAVLLSEKRKVECFSKALE